MKDDVGWDRRARTVAQDTEGCRDLLEKPRGQLPLVGLNLVRVRLSRLFEMGQVSAMARRWRWSRTRTLTR